MGQWDRNNANRVPQKKPPPIPRQLMPSREPATRHRPPQHRASAKTKAKQSCLAPAPSAGPSVPLPPCSLCQKYRSAATCQVTSPQAVPPPSKPAPRPTHTNCTPSVHSTRRWRHAARPKRTIPVPSSKPHHLAKPPHAKPATIQRRSRAPASFNLPCAHS